MQSGQPISDRGRVEGAVRPADCLCRQKSVQAGLVSLPCGTRFPSRPEMCIRDRESPYYYLLDAADSGFSFIDLRPPRLKNDNKTVEKSLKSSSFTQTFIIFLSSPKYHE